LQDDFSGRKWVVRVQSTQDAIKSVTEAKASKKEAGSQAKLQENKQKIIDVLNTRPDGETKKVIAELAGLQSRDVGPALVAMNKEGIIVSIRVRKGAGNGKANYDGWQLKYHFDLANAESRRNPLSTMGTNGVVRKGKKRSSASMEMRQENDTDAFDSIAVSDDFDVEQTTEIDVVASRSNYDMIRLDPTPSF